MDTNIQRTQITILDLQRRLHDAHMSTIAATTALQRHEAAFATSSLTTSAAYEELRRVLEIAAVVGVEWRFETVMLASEVPEERLGLQEALL